MADNYLEKRYDEVFGNGGTASARHCLNLDALLLRNRSIRGFDKQYKVHPLQMEAILSVNPKLASGMNAQRLRFRVICGGEQAVKVMEQIKLGSSLPGVKLPLPGTEPEAFIIVCSTVEENAIVDIDLGISLQSMLLKAVELGLNGIIVRNFNPDALATALDLPLKPLAVLAIGKSAETVKLVPAKNADSLKYYREDGVHFVPKLQLEDLKV